MVKIKYVAYLAHIYGKREEEVKLKKPVRVRDLVKPKESVEIIILVNGKVASWDTVVRDDDVITLIPPVSGG